MSQENGPVQPEGDDRLSRRTAPATASATNSRP